MLPPCQFVNSHSLCGWGWAPWNTGTRNSHRRQPVFPTVFSSSFQVSQFACVDSLAPLIPSPLETSSFLPHWCSSASSWLKYSYTAFPSPESVPAAASYGSCHFILQKAFEQLVLLAMSFTKGARQDESYKLGGRPLVSCGIRLLKGCYWLIAFFQVVSIWDCFFSAPGSSSH